MKKWNKGLMVLAVAGVVALGAVGVTTEELQAARKAARDQMIDDAVAKGRISAEQAERLKSLQPGAGLIKAAGAGMLKVAHNVLDTAAGVIGISPEAARAELQAGKSLAQIAADRGVDRSALENG